MDVHLRICGRELLETEPVPNGICERFPPGAERTAWLRWLRARQGTEAPAELIDVRKRCGVMSRQLIRT
jgi:hypothetical protein